MVLNIIYDDRRFEKYEPLMNELATQGIADYKLWDCIRLPNVVESINASHKMIVLWAKENNLEEVCIAEDDVMFPANDGWEYFLKNKPIEYDLYLAATYCVPVENNKVTGFHLYMVHRRFYDNFLSVPDNFHIDTAMDSLKGNYIFCYPFAALQRPGHSANNKAFANYNAILREFDIYKGEPIHNIS